MSSGNSYTPCYHPKPRTGRTANDHRPLVNGICGFYVRVRHGRFTCRVWAWHRVEPVLPVGNKQVQACEGKLQQRADNEGRIDWEVRFRCDGGASPPACRRGVRGQEHSALGISRGGLVPRYMCAFDW